MPLDKKTQTVINGINDGTLANQLKNNTKYTLTGLMVGAAAGIVIASFTGKCRLCFAAGGALIGSIIGYVSSKKFKEKNYNCCI